MHSDTRAQGGQYDKEGETALKCRGFSEPVTDEKKTTGTEESSQMCRKRKAEDRKQSTKEGSSGGQKQRKLSGVRKKPKSQK